VSAPSFPDLPVSPLDPAWMAQMASAMFGALPVAHGTQAPGSVAPAGSPLASPAGFSPAVPGTPIPQGTLPGQNLIPASPGLAASLGNRAPAMLPAAAAGNGVPDKLHGAIPAYEPRMGGALLGEPYYFLERAHGHPAGPVHDPLDALAAPALAHTPARAQPAARLSMPEPPAASGTPQFYFVDALVLPADDRGAFDVHAVRRDFPTLQERINGHPLVWFDNAATTHKPQPVIDRLARFYAHENSNIHRAAHELAGRATDAYEGARETVRRFINAPEVEEVVFVRGATEAINLVAKSWGMQHIGKDDEIVVSHLEHHANIVPWQQLAAAKGARLRVIPVDDSGQLRLDEFGKLLGARTKLVAVTQVSNALGTVTPVAQIAAMARAAGARVLVDAAQSVSHMRVDVQALDADFLVFSGHKVFGPTGIGVLWGKREVLEDMPPWQGGGNMIADVTFEHTEYQGIPNKFEAGTGNIADAAGLGAALDYVSRIGIENIARYEHALLEYGMRELGAIRGVRMIGTAQDKASVMSFVLAGYETGEVGAALNRQGIAVRTGHHCAQPILRRFGVEATVRPSLAFYNTREEIDRLACVVRELAGRGRAR
jgi:cysteine desulfurase/selenocysteine lyase